MREAAAHSIYKPLQSLARPSESQRKARPAAFSLGCLSSRCLVSNGCDERRSMGRRPEVECLDFDTHLSRPAGQPKGVGLGRGLRLRALGSEAYGLSVVFQLWALMRGHSGVLFMAAWLTSKRSLTVTAAHVNDAREHSLPLPVKM